MGTDLIRAVPDWQAGLDDCQAAMGEALRGVMMKALVDRMKEEVAALCGPYYRPAPGAAQRRAGSARGQF